MDRLEIEVGFSPISQLLEEERLRGIAKWLAREYMASLGCDELPVEEQRETPLIEKILEGKKCSPPLFRYKQI